MLEDFRESPLSYLAPAEGLCGVGLFVDDYFTGAGCGGVVADSECVRVCFFESENVVEDSAGVVFDVGGVAGSVEVSIKVGEGELHFVFLFVFCAFFLRVSFFRGSGKVLRLSLGVVS